MKKIFRLTILLWPLTLSAYSQEMKPVIYLWPGGAPGFENRKSEPEQAKDWWVRNIHNPSVTVYMPPREKANGSAVVICPGGGHRNLVYNSEGAGPAEYLTSLGITAFVLKYRLFREENSPYTQEHAMQDGRRAMRLVRKEVSRWNLDPHRIGIMGFSAGGELAGWVAFDSPGEKLVAADSIDQVSCRPDFLVLVYPGPLVVPEKGVAGGPPLFMVAANDDECCSEPVVTLLQLYRKEKIRSEVHLYAQGSHAFNMGKRSNLTSIQAWPQRLADWLSDNQFLKPERR